MDWYIVGSVMGAASIVWPIPVFVYFASQKRFERMGALVCTGISLIASIILKLLLF